jgi:methylenetetrahydrofolate dehydrogenase (NADP+)/methenyltetrahydrofolate cyclohydrolase
MSAQILSGKALQAQIFDQVSSEVQSWKSRGVTPTLALVLVGTDPSSSSYVALKRRSAEQVGLAVVEHRLDASTSQGQLEGLIQALGASPDVHGVLCQLPLPSGLSEETVLQQIPPEKDVDGLHPLNLGRLASGRPQLLPCTPLGVLRLLEYLKLDLAGRSVVLVGRGALVGRPLAQMLSAPPWDATVTLCHSQTRNLPGWTSQAEVLISATGVPGLIRQSMVRPGAVVIDVGNTAVADPSSAKGYRMAGDVAFEEVSKVASWITPVPGGVGPMTIAMLLENTLRAVRLQHA